VDTIIGDGAELGHASSLHAGQVIPAGQRWIGSPAEPAGRPLDRPRAMAVGRGRRFCYGALQLLIPVLVWIPAGFLLSLLFLPQADDPTPLSLTDPRHYLREALLTSAFFWGAVVLGVITTVALPRLLCWALPADRVFPLYGWRWAVQHSVAGLTSRRFFMYLFGDSSAIVHWLRAMGWDLSRVVQTGSNFGMAVKQEVPGLSAVGSGTMVSDGLSMMNADFSATSFRVRRVALGADNFVGNHVVYPPGGRTGDDCLLATKVHVPVDGPIRTGVGLLGSPPFEIPRSVERDRAVEEYYRDPARRRAALRLKNRHNAVTAALFLFVRWLHAVGLVLILTATVREPGLVGATLAGAGVAGMLVFSIVYPALVDRCLPRPRPMQCSIYDPRFWRHERYWKVPEQFYTLTLNGTPFKGLLWRALGVRIGRRVFDDGCWMTERSLVSIGDDCCLGEHSVIQSHSLEEGAFKSDHIRIAARSTVGIGGFVHYGVTMEEGSVLCADAFLMKGEQVGPGERWAGNPARMLATAPEPAASPPVGVSSTPVAGPDALPTPRRPMAPTS
jgi:non-ribosomal peptide synthetase-like protein